jgi:hypothetical protein
LDIVWIWANHPPGRWGNENSTWDKEKNIAGEAGKTMITHNIVAEMTKNDIPANAAALSSEDIPYLIELLNEKDDNLRYHAFLLLQNRSQIKPDVYPYWDELVSKFNSANSYHRSIGLMLIADNVCWDQQDKFDPLLETYLSFVNDEKPVTVRQCIQSLVKIVPSKPHLSKKIADTLLSIDLSSRKETQQKILLMDILSVLAVIRRYLKDERVERYMVTAMTGEVLDKKAKAEIEKLLKA